MRPFLPGLAALLCGLAGLAQPQGGQQPPPLPPGVTIRAQAQPPKATVGDRIRIDIEITLPAGFRARLAPLDKQAGEFTILDYHPGPEVPGPDSEGTPARSQKAPESRPEIHRARIITALYRTGKFEFPPLPIVIRDPQGRETAAATAALAIEIASVLDGKDTALRDLKQQAELDDPARWLYWLGLGLLALTLLLAWLAWRRRKKPAPARPVPPALDPFSRAEADLRDLAGRGLIQRGLVKQHYVILSDIVKRILEAGYSISTSEKTTSEIMAALRESAAGRPEASGAETAQFETFLSGCDLVKFAKYVPSDQENQETIEASFTILDVCRKRAGTASPIPQSAEGS